MTLRFDAVLAFALLLLAALLSGCVHTEITLPTGGKFSRTSLLSTQSVGDVTVRLQGPDQGVKIENYGHNGAEVAAQALETAAAALKAPRP